MPAGRKNEESSANPGQRTTFRPPWVKDGPSPLPVPSAPWTPKNSRRDSNTSNDGKQDNPLANVQLRKTSIPNKEIHENGSKESTFVKPSLKPVPPKAEATPKQKEEKFSVKLNSVAERIKKEPPKPTKTCDEEIDREIPSFRNKLVREESMRRLSQNPPPPPMPPMPPPPPPMVPPEFKRDPLSLQQLERLEALRARPKTRPDWTEMLKQIEGNKKLKHVQCNDRSNPVLPKSRATEHFLYESEKATAHNELLKQIQQGICLKKVKTNDRSKPQLEGLRKFRRQMTIEEQIQKSVSMASIPPDEIADEADEMDDIDKVRDDLQSTKQMLAFEMRNKEAQIRENKRLMTKMQQLEAELEKERAKNREASTGTSSDSNSKVMKSLQEDADKARKVSEQMEKKYHDATDQLENTKSELEDVKKQKEEIEKRLQEILQGKRTSFAGQKENTISADTEEEEEESESSEESDGSDNEERVEKRLQKQVKQLKNKLRNFKNKEDNAKKERVALREIIKKNQAAMKEEKKKYKELQKEVNKMAALMKDVGSDEEADDEEEREEKEESEEESEESSEESESEEESDDGSQSERSQSEAEDAPSNKRKDNYTLRASRHEKILAAIKKGNYLLKTNAERLQDDLNKQKEMTAALQEDLDSVLSELG